MQFIRPAYQLLIALTLCLAMWSCGEPTTDSPLDTISSSDGMTNASINGASDASADDSADATLLDSQHLFNDNGEKLSKRPLQFYARPSAG